MHKSLTLATGGKKPFQYVFLLMFTRPEEKRLVQSTPREKVAKSWEDLGVTRRGLRFIANHDHDTTV